MKDTINIKSSGVFKKIINGDLVQDMAFKTDYDGDHAEFFLNNNGKAARASLDNAALMNLLNRRANSKNLADRLLHDFPLPKAPTNAKAMKRAIKRAKAKAKTMKARAKEAKAKEAKAKEKREKREKRVTKRVTKQKREQKREQKQQQ